MTRSNKWVFFFCFLVLEAFTFINSYVYDLKGATVDSDRFREKAYEWARYGGEFEFATDAQFYIQFLGIIDRYLGGGEFLGAQFGIVALLIAGYYFLQILKFAQVKHAWVFILLFYMWPSLLPRVTTTMREPYLILVIVAMCYHLLLYMNLGKQKNLFKVILWGAFGALFHKAYAVLFLGSLAYVFLSRAGNFKSFDFLVRIIFVGGVSALLFQFSDLFSSVKGLNAATSLVTLDSEYMSRIVEYKSNREFRTTYSATMDFSSLWAFLKSAPVALLYYLFAPFPWMIRTPLDVYAFLEGVVRMVGLYALVKMPWQERRFILPVALVVFMLIFVWAAGTANYGTATRHHITTNWFFFLTIGMWLSRKRGE